MALLTAPVLSFTVTSPLQVPQPPACGPWFSSSAKPHFTNALLQLRMDWTMASKSVCTSSATQVPPEASVTHWPRSGCRLWSVVMAPGGPPYQCQATPAICGEAASAASDRSEERREGEE